MSKNLDHSCDAPSGLSTDEAARLGVELRAAVACGMEWLRLDAKRLVRPQVGRAWRAGATGHYHTAPEMFVQLTGWTDFTFPDSVCRLQAGQVLLLPPHLQHSERVGPDASGPFANAVLYADGASLSVHLARERQAGVPAVAYLESTRGQGCTGVAQCLMEACDRPLPAMAAHLGLAWAAVEQQRAAALVAAALARTWQLLALPGTCQSGSTALVAKVRLWVKNQLGDAALSVQGLAEQAGCTADHLSQRFRRETGEPLLAYIARLRMERACQLLQSTELAVKEVAWACGYSRAGYFIQAFRRLHGVTPQVWRKR